MTVVPLFHFPAGVLREAEWSWEITSQLVQSGQTATGVNPATRLDGGGAWKVTLSQVDVRGVRKRDRRSDENPRRAWRSFSAVADGGANPVVVPMRINADAPFPIEGGEEVRRYDDILHTDDVPFSSGVGYQVGTIDAALDEAALMNATTLTIAITYGGDLQGGEHFSIDHPVLRHRLYRLRTAKDNGDGTWDITIRPGLRADTAADTKLNFNSPKCVMRLATGNAMDAMFEGPGMARPSVSFIEAFPPFPEP